MDIFDNTEVDNKRKTQQSDFTQINIIYNRIIN